MSTGVERISPKRITFRIAGRDVSLPETINNAENNLLAYRQGQQVDIARLQLCLSFATPDEQVQIRETVRRETKLFWEKVGSRRFAEAGSKLICFENTFRSMGVREEVAAAINPQAGEGIIDGGSGPATQYPYLRKYVQNQSSGQGDLAWYVSVDNNSSAGDGAGKLYRSLGVDSRRVFHLSHDLEEGLPTDLQSWVRDLDAGSVALTSTMAANYLPEERFAALINDTKSLGRELELPTRIAIVGMNGDKLNPGVLAKHFCLETLPGLVKAGRIRTAIEATISIPWMVRFGKEFKRMVPTLPKDRMIICCQENGFKVNQYRENILWGQMFVLGATAEQ